MRILITSGGTSEPIDGVRVVTNLSTGSTGAALAQSFLDAGHEVHMVIGRFATYPEGLTSIRRYTSFKSLEEILEESLQNIPIDVVVHLAAVSDFSPEEIIYSDGRRARASSSGKLSSTEEFSISFKKNHKIIDKIRSFCDTEIVLIGFKLTDTSSEEERLEAIEGLLSRGCCDLVVHNDLHGIEAERHEAGFYQERGCIGRCSTKAEMAAWLLDYLGDRR